MCTVHTEYIVLTPLRLCSCKILLTCAITMHHHHHFPLMQKISAPWSTTLSSTLPARFILDLYYCHLHLRGHLFTLCIEKQFSVTCQLLLNLCRNYSTVSVVLAILYLTHSTTIWTVGGSRSTQRELLQTRGEHANSTQKDTL